MPGVAPLVPRRAPKVQAKKCFVYRATGQRVWCRRWRKERPKTAAFFTKSGRKSVKSMCKKKGLMIQVDPRVR